MKVYILVAKNKDGDSTFDMPIYFHRAIRAYNSEARAKVYARKFNADVVELDVKKGKVVYEG